MRWRWAALIAMCCVPLAQAHDSWFAPVASARADELRLALGTGNRFPVQELSVGAGALKRHGCRAPGASAVPLHVVGETAEALQLRARIRTAGTAAPSRVSCWAQMPTFELEMEHDKVALYLDEAHASEALRQAWAAMRARGLPWRERYTKHARHEWFAAQPGAPRRAFATSAVAMGMDIVLLALRGAPHAGDTLRLEVRRDGRALADQPIELLAAAGQASTWVRTDAAGRASVVLPARGEYLLRGIDLRPSSAEPNTWDSRFITLTFTVL